MLSASLEQKVKLNPLIQAYLEGALIDATDYAPNWEGIASALENKSFSYQQRQFLIDGWEPQYRPDSARQLSIKKLSQENVFTITTGHQLCMASGPAYTIYKIASAISLAKKCAEKWSKFSFIPVFWMASEDHDFQEVSQLYTKSQAYVWETDHGGPVGRLKINQQKLLLQPWIDWLIKIGALDIASTIEASLNGKTLSESIRTLIDTLFGDYELLILDADSNHLKGAFAPIVIREMLEGFVQSGMASSAKWLDEMGWAKQVNPREINLFYQSDTSRKRIVRENGMWKVLETDIVWTETAWRHELELFPERFSPNVTLRPIYQEIILPNLAYIGGPGEVSYWLQLQPVFSALDLKMPVVLLRDSALLLNSNLSQKWQKWGERWEVFQLDLSHIIKDLVSKESISFDATKNSVSEAMNKLKADLANLDKSLETAADMELNKQIQGLEVLEKKMAKFIRQKEEVKAQQWTKFFDDILPGGEPQERHFNFLDLQSGMSQKIIPLLVQMFDPINPRMHVFMDIDPDTIAVKSPR